MAQGDFSRINTNIGALNALNSLKAVQSKLGVHQLRLATGKRINEAADDPAGLTIATKFQYRASGLGVALDNIGDAKNMLAVAEGGLQKIKDILIKMRDKANAAASDSLGSSERAAIKSQLDQFGSEINDIVETTRWNNKRLLDGLTDFDGSTVVFQVGVDTGSNERVSLSSFGSVKTTDLSIGNTVASASEVADASSIVSTIATSSVTTGLTELASGNYTLRLVLGTFSGATATSSYVQLIKDGVAQTVDADGNGTAGLIDNKVTFTYSTLADSVITFGNGMVATIASNLTATSGWTANATVSYARQGDYNGTVDTASNARSAVDALDTAINTVSTRLQTVGSYVSRLNFREETVTIAKVNVEAAFSRIMNADMAYEQLEATKMQILQQTATAMLTQANTAPQGVLQLFR